jgi:hypothetical protein
VPSDTRKAIAKRISIVLFGLRDRFATAVDGYVDVGNFEVE